MKKINFNKLQSQVEIWTKEKVENGYFIKTEIQPVIIAVIPDLMKLQKRDKLAQEVLNEELLEKDDPKHFCKAELFYSEGIELIDLNGNPIPQDTPNVLVMIGSIKEQRIIRAIYKQNVKMLDTGEEQLTLTNVVVKGFSSVKECAKYIGVNNLLDRTMKASEKVALASKQNEVVEEITRTSQNEGVSTNTVIKTCSGGNIITTSQWNDMVRGKQIESLEIDFETGKKIISRLKELCNKEGKEINKFCSTYSSIIKTKLEKIPSLNERQRTTLSILGKLSPTDFTSELRVDDITALVEMAWDETINPA